MRVAVAADGELTMRAAQSLSTHPDIDVVLLAPATSTQFTVVETPVGCEAVFGGDGAARAAREARLPAVLTDDHAGIPGVRWASVEGLALALAAAMDEVDRVAVAVPGDEEGDAHIVFPSPIDSRAAARRSLGGRTLYRAGGEGPLAAAVAFGRLLHRVVMDDHRFMAAIALAAGIGILMEDGANPAVPVWERPEPYLRAAADMGLVIGERAAA